MSELYANSCEEEKSWHRMSVLVTGGTGLVGRGIKSVLMSRYPDSNIVYDWHFLSSRDVNLLDRKATFAFFKKMRPSYVIHLAARVGGLYRNSRNEGGERVRMFADNLRMNLNVMDACLEVDVQRTVCCLSTCVYPDSVPGGYPFSEDVLHAGPPHPSNEGYAYAKRMLEVHARLANELCGGVRSFVCVVPTNVYGPHDNFNLEDGHVLPALVHRCYLAKRDGTDFVVRGTGSPRRQFIHAEDLGALILRVMFEWNGTKPMTLAPDAKDEVSIKDIALRIAECTGLPKERVVFDDTFADGQLCKTADNTLMRTTFPNVEGVSMSDGIACTVKWFKQYFDTARK